MVMWDDESNNVAKITDEKIKAIEKAHETFGFSGLPSERKRERELQVLGEAYQIAVEKRESALASLLAELVGKLHLEQAGRTA